MGDNQSQKSGDGATAVQAGRDVNITTSVTLAVPFDQISEFVRSEMAKNGGLVWEAAQRMLREAGLEAGTVALKTVVPLLHYASLEENEYLRERWAALLANTASSSSRVLPGYPEILRQLTPEDVRFLAAIYTGTKDRIANFEHLSGRQQSRLSEVGTPLDLERLYCETAPREDTEETEFAFQVVLDNLRRLRILDGPMSGNEKMSITDLGLHFLVACHERPGES